MLTDTTLGDEDPDADGLDNFTHEQIRSFSMALGVDYRLVDSELLCYLLIRNFSPKSTHLLIRMSYLRPGVQFPSRSNHAPETQIWHMMILNPKSFSLELTPDHPPAYFMAP